MGEGGNLLRSPGVGEVLVIRRDVFLEVRIRFHGHDILDAGECGLDEAIVGHEVGELGVEDPGHQRAGGGRIVDLSIRSIHQHSFLYSREGVEEKMRLRSRSAYHCPLLSPIPRHECFHHWTMHFGHILPIILLTQSLFFVSSDGEDEFLSWFLSL